MTSYEQFKNTDKGQKYILKDLGNHPTRICVHHYFPLNALGLEVLYRWNKSFSLLHLGFHPFLHFNKHMSTPLKISEKFKCKRTISDLEFQTQCNIAWPYFYSKQICTNEFPVLLLHTCTLMNRNMSWSHQNSSLNLSFLLMKSLGTISVSLRPISVSLKIRAYPHGAFFQGHNPCSSQALRISAELVPHQSVWLTEKNCSLHKWLLAIGTRVSQQKRGGGGLLLAERPPTLLARFLQHLHMHSSS